VGQRAGQLRRVADLGVGLSNLLHGLALDGNGDFTGTFWDLFSPYTVVAGLVVVVVFAYHGATFLTLRPTGGLLERAEHAARRLLIPAFALACLFIVWTIVVAVDRNDKDVFPPVLPAVLAIAAFVLGAAFLSGVDAASRSR
jgi:cytochrome d ubiquinol oxidase subunit II